MNKREPPKALPRTLLPESELNGDSADVEARLSSLMAAAGPTLAEYRTGRPAWWVLLADKMRPQLAFTAAAAAAIALAVHIALPAPRAGTEASLPLAAIIGEGNTATTLLPFADEDIDPVLALVLLEEETE